MKAAKYTKSLVAILLALSYAYCMKATELKAQINRLRTEVDSDKFPEMPAVADSLERMLDNASRGGNRRAKKLTKKRRKEIATKAAKARWAK